MVIQITKDSQIFTYNSYAKACELNGYVGSPMNANACKKYLAKQGFDIDSIIELEGKSSNPTSSTSGSNPTKKSNSIIEKLIKDSTVIDKDLIVRIKDELTQTIASAESMDDLLKIKKLQNDLELASNPQPTKRTVLEYVAKLYDAYEDEKYALEEPETEVEPE